MAKRPVPERVAHYHVYSYEHLDDLTFIRSPAEVDEDHEFHCRHGDLEADVRALLRRFGWEGDGELGILWLPPFVDVGVEDTWGTYIWVVKQHNNGTSFIASPFELPFERLASQNEEPSLFEGMVPQGILHCSREGLEEQLDKIVRSLERDIRAVGSLPVESTVAAHLLERAQGQMVQALITYLDDCYLQILIEVVRDGNKSALKLRKSRANLDPGTYLPEDFEGDVNGFFTLNGLISDMWATYKFEPFRVKLDMLLKPLNYVLEESVAFELRKHVALRNAVQHHEGWISGQLLTDLGRDSIPVATAEGSRQLAARTRILFTIEEVRAFQGTLFGFAIALDKHADACVASRAYTKPSADGT